MKLQEVWQEIESWLKNGCSIIPVRDKQDGDRLPKTPYTGWKKYQSEIISKGELFRSLEYYNTSAVAVITGSVSGNLEIIDIDSKYKAGIDALLFKEIREVYPSIWDRLRIHKTPSGGYHLIYRISDHIAEGNIKLASRKITEEEIAAAQERGIKKPAQYINFLETRGEGGYALLPPSLGYEVQKESPISEITWEERCSLIMLCRAYDEKVSVEPTPRPSKSQNDYYSKNPFEDYNQHFDPISLMREGGWSFSRENNQFIWFTRPDKKSGISASYNKSKNVFYIFTVSTDLEGGRGYNPSSMLSEFQFGGDKSKCYKWLIDNGYGEVKRNVEQTILKQAVISGRELPPNFSEQAKQQYEIEKALYKENHPFGTFWFLDEGKYKISREELYNVAHELGFRNHMGDVAQINGRFINIISKGEFFDIMKEYIKEEEADIYIDICNVYESFMQNSGKFTIERLRPLETDNIISDSQDECYKFYNDKCVRVTSQGIKALDYEDVEGMIWSHKMLGRDYPREETKSSGLYVSYLTNSTGFTDSVKSIIGYLCHDFKSESAGYIVVMVEKVLNPKDGGGSGKNIFGNILRNMITVCTVPGSSVQFNEKFLQSWNGQRIFFLADIPKKIDWLFLKEQATGFGLLKKLYKDEREISPEHMPKLLLNTNYSYDDVDGGLKRRIVPIEFTDYYTIHGGVDAVHGKMFPTDFNDEDWADFDRVVLECIRYNISEGCKLKVSELSDTGWSKKFIGNFTEATYDFIRENLNGWSEQGFVSNKYFNELYDNFCKDIDLNPKYKASSIAMNRALEEYCKRSNIDFDKDARVNSLRGRHFGSKETEEELPF